MKERVMKTLIAAGALMLSCAPAFAQTTPAPAPAPVPTSALAAAPAAPAADSVANVYGTALGPGWENKSSATTELSVELNGSTRRPIDVLAKGFEALYLRHAPFSTAPYRSLAFLIQAAKGTGQVRVSAVVDGKPVEGKQKLVKLAPGGWTRVEIGLAAIGAEKTTIEGIWIQNDSADPAPDFFVTEIAFHE
jgi:hypothetical protein